MPLCVIVLKQITDPNDLSGKLSKSKARLTSCQLVQPSHQDNASMQASQEVEANTQSKIQIFELNKVKLLNPKLARRGRQRAMALWLMPFGFLAGLSFTKMTGLKTFEEIGLGSWGEATIGSLLGMGSGLIGSFAAAGSPSTEKNKDIKNLRKKNQEGNWLLILETPAGIDLPWEIIQEINPLEIVRLNQL